jgi:hypothetical protein
MEPGQEFQSLRRMIGMVSVVASVVFAIFPFVITFTPEGGRQLPPIFLTISACCALIAISCFWARSRPVTVRLVAGLFLCAILALDVFVIRDVFGFGIPLRDASEEWKISKLINALLASLAVGVPSAVFVVRGPSAFRGKGTTSPRSDLATGPATINPDTGTP